MEILAEQAPKLKPAPPCLWCRVKPQERKAQGFTGFCEGQGHEGLYIKRALDKTMREASLQSSGMAAMEQKDEVLTVRKARRKFLAERREQYARGEEPEYTQVMRTKAKGVVL